MARSLIVLLAFNVDWFALSHFNSYLKRFADLGHKVHIFAEDTGRIAELSLSFASVHKSLVGRRSGSLVQELLQLFIIGFWLAFLRPDIVECISIKPILTWGVLARLFNSRSIICYITGLGSILQGSSPLLPFVRFLLRYALSGKHTRVVVENFSIRDLIVRSFSISTDNILVLNGVGVPLDLFYPPLLYASSRDFRPMKILMASRLLRDKGVIEYLKAASLLSHKHDNKMQFLLAGRFDSVNPTALSMEDISLYLAPCGVVQYLGISSDVASLLRDIQLFVLPSYHEGFPRSIIEAAACGIPVVTTNVPGCSDAVVPGITGLVVPPCDVSALVSAIDYLFDNPDLMLVMSRKARDLAVKKYDENFISKNHIDFVLRAMS